MATSGFSAEIDMNPIKQILQERGLQEFGSVQKFLDKRIIEYAEPYTPRDNGILYASALNATDFGSGEVIYNTPYAHYLYEGILYVDPVYDKGAFFNENFGFWSRKGVQKVPSDRKLNYKGGGSRGKKWVDRMWTEKKNEIIAEVQAKVDRRGN